MFNQGVFVPPIASPTDVNILKNNELKILYYASISAASGQITIPNEAEVILDDFPSGLDAVVETIVSGKPTGYSPVTAGGVTVTVTSFDTDGNYVLSGTPSGYPVALLYVLKIKAIYYQNLNFNNIIEAQNIQPSAATVAQLNTGTDNASFASPLGLEGSKYLTQSGSKLSATASGTDTYTATISPAITAYVNTQRFFIKFTNANTGAATLNLNSLGAIAIKKNVSEALVANDIKAGQILCVAYDGTNFQIVGGGGGSSTEGFGVTFDGGGGVISVNNYVQYRAVAAGTITDWYISSINPSDGADLSGSIVIDIKRNGTSIIGGGGNKPTLSSQASNNAAASGWTSFAVAAGDILAFYVVSATTVTRVNCTIKMI